MNTNIYYVNIFLYILINSLIGLIETLGHRQSNDNNIYSFSAVLNNF